MNTKFQRLMNIFEITHTDKRRNVESIDTSEITRFTSIHRTLL